MDYNSGIIKGEFNNPEYLGFGYRWSFQWCTICGLWLGNTLNGVRESTVCTKCKRDKNIELEKV